MTLKRQRWITHTKLILESVDLCNTTAFASILQKAYSTEECKMTMGDEPLNRLASFLLILTISMSTTAVVPSNIGAVASLTPVESHALALVNATEALSYALHLESIALSHPAFRAAGSVGADETADWIAEQFQGFGLQVNKEEFQFTCWDLKSKPTLTIDDDGDPATMANQTVIESFQCEHYSWPGNAFADLVVLPLPPAANYIEIGAVPIGDLWDSIDTTGKIVLVGREVRSSNDWHSAFCLKLHSQPPVAVIHTWWYSWMSFVPDFFSSTGGRPMQFDHYFWALHIPVGFVNYNDGLVIRNREAAMNVSAKVVIDATVKAGPQYNVVGKLAGYEEPDKSVIVCGHYDSVMTAGFCDNAAGVAGVMEVAHALTEAMSRGIYRPKYSVLFIGLSGEELGLVGAIQYVAKHKFGMQNIVAVINLDCIGSRDLEVTETQTYNGINLAQIVLNAAADVGIGGRLIEPGQSDETPFLSPFEGDNILMNWWDMSLGIAGAHPVGSSVMISSAPLVYRDLWDLGEAGWIHTSYDNSTSTTTLGWVQPQNYEAHLKVTELTALRVTNERVLLTDLNHDGEVNILDITLVARAFGTKYGDARWNPVADLNVDGAVNILDMSMVARDFGKTSP
jgi:hypothetical protein